MSDLFTVTVHPIALREGDFLPKDPDDPQRDARWWITSQPRQEVRGDVSIIVVGYVTEDGTTGMHGFENGSVLVDVVPPFAAPPAPTPRATEPAGTTAEVTA